MLTWSGHHRASGGAWSATCVRCKSSVDVVGSKKGIADAANFLEHDLGWRRDHRTGRKADRCEWTCCACKLHQLDAAKHMTLASPHSSFARNVNK